MERETGGGVRVVLAPRPGGQSRLLHESVNSTFNDF